MKLTELTKKVLRILEQVESKPKVVVKTLQWVEDGVFRSPDFEISFYPHTERGRQFDTIRRRDNEYCFYAPSAETLLAHLQRAIDTLDAPPLPKPKTHTTDLELI